MKRVERKLVLVIDDEEYMRDSCRQVLEKAGWQVAAVSDGITGLELFHKITPDIVFIDLKMPGMNGMEVLSRIVEQDPSVATVVVTGYATVDSAVEAMKHGAYDFLPKPFTPAELRVVAWRNWEKRSLYMRNRQLQAEKEQIKENFVTLVSHEMRAPLVVVDQYIEVLLEGLAGDINSRQREILLKMRTKTEWLLALVKEWLSMSRLQGNTLLDRMEPIDIELLLNEAVELLASSAQEQQVAVSVVVPGAIERLEGDREALLHAFLNLLDNAVKYNNPQGKADVVVKTDNGQMVVEVCDNGRGIPEGSLPFVFDEFYRVRTPEHPKTTGTGLGLSFVKKIVEAHGGHVQVSSTLGQGSTFTVCLPLKAEIANRQQAEKAG
ncbi:MAG TPA: hybrid sensor histidine kinase/response regulator [Planctomycetota bacterium]|nr:hybrid sensor histidine kinase/response regulator [Planctomycetota bacterium]